VDQSSGTDEDRTNYLGLFVSSSSDQNRVLQMPNSDSTTGFRLEAYNGSYIFNDRLASYNEAGVINNPAQNITGQGLFKEEHVGHTLRTYLGTPWFHWQVDSSHPGYQVMHEGRMI